MYNFRENWFPTLTISVEHRPINYHMTSLVVVVAAVLPK